MTPTAESSWVVLKFGGTSVSTLDNWRNVAAVVRARLAEGQRVLVVHSALSGETDRLEKLLSAAFSGTHEALLALIEERHLTLAAQLGIDSSTKLESYFAELRQMAAQLAQSGEASDRMRARVLAFGELLATELGARYLAAQGITTTWWDVRLGLHAEQRHGLASRATYLSATCDYAPDPQLRTALEKFAGVVLTQGFIAGNDAGDTVLLGRGGSDTSAAYLAAKLQARRLEIWTDVPGMFSANPRATPSARLLRALHYDEAQEIASSGAKVLHPRCILPAKQGQIPLWVYATQTPGLEGSHINAEGGDGRAQVKAVCIKKGITMVTLDSPGMWHEVGFLADAFQIFKQHGLSVDQVATSETNVTVSLDPAANTLDPAVIKRLTADLSGLCRAQVIGPCASVSLVGRNIRAILHQLGGAFEVFADQRIYMVSQAANDLNLTFVVDENQGDRLAQELHGLLIRPVPGDTVLGPTWEQLYATAPATSSALQPWWRTRRAELLTLMAQRDCAYVYNLEALRAAVQSLKQLKSVSRLLYAVKANPHPQLLRQLAADGVAFDCVSRGEIERVLQCLPAIDRTQILFTPNFAPRAEYEWAFAQGVTVTVDNLYALRHWPQIFRGRSIFARLDTGTGRGHHQHVRTAGTHAKFGVPLDELAALQALCAEGAVTVVGLHAHPGSGVFDVGSWADTAEVLLGAAERFPKLEALDLGGGLGVPDSHEQPGLDLQRLDAVLGVVAARRPELKVWLEPGRFLVATAGVLLARVTQIKAKGEMHYVGVATGMNSLIRPVLYGAWHEIVNLTRLDLPATEVVDVVGPICESGDFLGHDRLLAPSEEGDVLLIANAGAYGHAMSSNYNLRAPALELLIGG